MTYFFYSPKMEATCKKSAGRNGKPYHYCYVLVGGEWKQFTEQRQNNPIPHCVWNDCKLVASGDNLQCKYSARPMIGE